jgi:hypothetical protein
MSASNGKPGSPDRPDWLDTVLGCLSPPFSFRDGGSAITAGKKPDRQDDALPATGTPAWPNGGQRR